jgi:hypothetical protein
MLSGRPTIVTDYSGTSDFADENCAYVVGHSLVPVQTYEYPGVEDQHWADASLSQAAAHMRRVHERPDDARRIGQLARDRIIRLYSPDVVGAAMLAALQELLARTEDVGQEATRSRDIKEKAGGLSDAQAGADAAGKRGFRSRQKTRVTVADPLPA